MFNCCSNFDYDVGGEGSWCVKKSFIVERPQCPLKHFKPTTGDEAIIPVNHFIRESLKFQLFQKTKTKNAIYIYMQWSSLYMQT